jgi:mannose-6-phosphate isomerase-like protein (cupin superfamily)
VGERPAFPGAVGVSHLRVYDWEAPDGLRGGTPHVHSVCTEAYAVVAGRGAVHALTPQGFDEVPLEPGTFVWFTPGTIHRLVNHGGLEIFVLMQNAGLPEAGDMVITFPDEVLADPAAYAEAATLPEDERTTAGTGEAARHRRDHAIEGFAHLCDGGPEALALFHERAAALLAPRAAGWFSMWERGPLAEVERTGEQLARLVESGAAPHLADASIHRLPPPAAERRMGCCGTLGVYLPAHLGNA